MPGLGDFLLLNDGAPEPATLVRGRRFFILLSQWGLPQETSRHILDAGSSARDPAEARNRFFYANRMGGNGAQFHCGRCGGVVANDARLGL